MHLTYGDLFLQKLNDFSFTKNLEEFSMYIVIVSLFYGLLYNLGMHWFHKLSGKVSVVASEIMLAKESVY
jgi:hypothetical protein